MIIVIEFDKDDGDESKFDTFNIDIIWKINNNINDNNKIFLFFNKYKFTWVFRGGLNVEIWVIYDIDNI